MKTMQRKDPATQAQARKKIMTAALALFSERGFKATTTREIAREACVNEVTIFRNFGNKEKLLETVLEDRMDLDSVPVEISLGLTENPEKDLLNFCTLTHSRLAIRADLFRIMLREQGANPLVQKKLGEFPPRIKAFWVKALGDILGTRARKELDMETAAIFLTSYFLRNLIMEAMIGVDPFHELSEETTGQVVDIFLNGVISRGDV